MRNRYQRHSTADEITEDFKANAREAFDAGARYMGAARDWFLQRAEEMQQRVFDQRFQSRKSEVDEEEDFLARAYRDAGRAARGEGADDVNDPIGTGGEGAGATRRGRHARAAWTGGSTPDWDREQGIERGRRGGPGRQGPAPHAYGYRGMGPRDYQRSDERIAEEINERLYESDAIDARDIAVQVNQGVALMTGTVPHRWMKHLAEDLAERCRGVTDVENQVRVQAQDTQEASAFTARSTVSSAIPTASEVQSPSSVASASASGRADTATKQTPPHVPSDTIGGGSRAATKPSGGTAH